MNNQSQNPWKLLLASTMAITIITSCVLMSGKYIINSSTEPPMPPEPVVTNRQMLATVAAPIHRFLLLAITPNVTFTCDIGSGGYDGVNFYEGRQPGAMALLKQFPATNVFPVSLDTNWPHFIEVRTFVNWPAPGVVQTITNDDQSLTMVTNTFYENPAVADLLYVPAGCSNIWLAQLTNGTMELVGWGQSGSVYSISNGDLAGNWVNAGTVTGTNGPWTVLVNGSQSAGFFRTSRTGP
jgi:hypothetical protein